MEEIKLDVHVRSEIGRRRINKIRHQKFVPAVVYGTKKKPTPIKVERSAYEKIMRAHHGASVLFHLNVMEDGKKVRDYSAIVREEQHDPVQDDLLHIDFLRISLTDEIEVKVNIVPKGDAVGVKKQGGSLDQPIHELSIICLPTKIPQQIEVDVTDLSIGDAVYVADLKLPEGVRTKHDPKAMVVSVVPPMKEEELQPKEATEPEVIGEKKKEAEGAAEAAAPEKAEDKSPKKPEKEKKEA
jgi:large subunit ribosomal protein L25